MDIPAAAALAKVSQGKFRVVIAVILSLIFLGFSILLAPRFITILSYFWPLFLSTAVFWVVMIVFFGRIPSPLAELYGDKEGEGLLDYVAGHPEQLAEY